MRILHVNNVDLLGNRFNGHDMQITLNKRGITAHQAVMERMGNDPHTILIPNADKLYIRSRITQSEASLSLHGMLYPFLFNLMDLPEFKAASIVHYHLLHNYFGSLPILPEITSMKPSVLTVHDPWIFTGHCIYPAACEKWKTGCNHCERKNVNFPIERDRTALEWELKRRALSKAKLDLIVASAYMEDLVRKSPITSNCRFVHRIPFGIDLNLFSPSKDRDTIRKSLQIPSENFVLCFRADPSPFKGFSCIEEMLKTWKPQRPVTLIAVGNKGMLTQFQRKYQILDFGWVTDDAKMAELYCACDLFLMPSTAEAFGLMAIEAMASERPVLVCEGTSLPSVTFAPDCGIVIPQNDSAAMTDAVSRLMAHPEEGESRGKRGRVLAEQNYRFEDYVDRHLKLYEQIITRKE